MRGQQIKLIHTVFDSDFWGPCFDFHNHAPGSEPTKLGIKSLCKTALVGEKVVVLSWYSGIQMNFKIIGYIFDLENSLWKWKT